MGRPRRPSQCLAESLARRFDAAEAGVSTDMQNVPSVEAQGARIPLLGLGTWDLRGRVCARVVEQALRLGYRHIDTAEMYDNEREVGEGLRASGVKRNDVFVTTKIWPSHFAPLELERTARECLGRLRLTARCSAARLHPTSATVKFDTPM